MGHNRNLADYAHHFDGTHIDLGSGNIETQGVVTYEDVTNVDAIGIITARAGVKVPDNQKVFLGTGDDLQIFHNGSNSYIDNVTGHFYIRNYSDDNDIYIQTDNGSGGLVNYLFCDGSSGRVVLSHYGSGKIETSSTGATVTGTLVSDSVTSELDLSAISSSISDTAVDVFVYDTRKDSDGGAWRKRTQHTSWYNETLNTSTRGSRKEFPAVAVIVTEDTKVTIYDGDDTSLPMWMVFLSGPNSSNERLLRYASNKASSMLNAVLCVATRDTLSYISFIDEYHNLYHTQDEYYFPERTGIVDRNTIIGEPEGPLGNYGIASSATNDVAMTVLPNAPIDDATGLPVPTIAVATDAGVSVIKDDGTVVDITASGYTATDNKIDFDHLNNVLYLESGGYPQRQSIPSSDIIRSAAGGRDRVYGGTSSYVPTMLGTSSNIVTNSNGFSSGSTSGLSILDYDSSQSQEMVAYITSDFNTGWMHGDIKGAFLSDTDTTNVTGSELITNTDFSSDLSGWTNGNPSQFTRVTNNVGGDTDGKLMYYATDGVLRTFYQYVTCVAGEKYVLSLRACSDTASAMVIDIDGTNVITIDDNNNAAFITKQHTFTAGSTSVRIRIESAAANRSYFTDFSVRLAVEDRSVNDNGLQVFGTITKSAVATGADLVAYSGNGTSNYLEQPYNSDLDFGANTEFSVMGWMYNTNVGGGQYIFDRSVTYNSSRDWQLWVAADLKYINMYIAGGQAVTSGNNAFPNNAWFQFVVVRTGGFAKIYINGVEKASTASTLSTIPASNVPMKVLYNCNQNTKLALLRISGSAPTAEQIKKIYEDEKVLFQENAKATLYGSSDAVTALGYDEDTELLHVGTSSGRSDFQGLRRINNTTTAVTTAISASDDLIAEQ